MSADDNLCQQFQFDYLRIHFERKENGVDARILLIWDFKEELNQEECL